MASPFETSGVQADIAPVQLRGGFTPDTGIAEAAQQIVGTVGALVTEEHKKGIREEVDQQASAVSLALKVTRFPSIHDSVFSEEALANPSVAQALAEYTQIQDATKQGRLPSTFALERLELIQNNAIRNAPEFEAEIRGAMRDATGQDPTRRLSQQLFSEPTTTKSAEQKAQDKLTIDAAQIGVTVEQMIGINQAAAQTAIELQKFDLAAKQGTYTLNTLGSEVINRGAVLVTDVMADVQRMSVAGQAIGVNEKLALTSKVNAAFGASVSAVLAKTANLNVSGAAVQAELAPLKAMQANVLAMIEDDTLQTVLARHNDVIINSTQNSLLNNPDYVAAYAIGGSRGFLDLVKFMGKSTTATGKALTAALSADAAIAFDLQQLPKQYSRIGTVEPLETVKARQARVMAAGVALGTTGIDEEFQILALEDIKKHGGEELAWSSFGSNKVLTATAKSNKLKAAFINMQVATSAGLSEELVALANNPSARIDLLVMSAAGELQYTPPLAVNRRGRVGAESVSDAELFAYVKRFNRANQISAKYNGAGILPSARYGGTVDYWNTIKQAATEVANPGGEDEPTVLKYIRDASGRIVLDTGGQ